MCVAVEIGHMSYVYCVATVHDIVTRGGRCLIPVFALGRAQELLLILGEPSAIVATLPNIVRYSQMSTGLHIQNYMMCLFTMHLLWLKSAWQVKMIVTFMLDLTVMLV